MITKEQQKAVSAWIAQIAPYPPTAYIVVNVQCEQGGEAEVRISPEGEIRSTTSGMVVKP
jgi:hypothetical protein